MPIEDYNRFLFEGAKGNVLYTGDFRAEETYMEGFKRSSPLGINSMTIHKLYLDTTFYKDRSDIFPTIQGSNALIMAEIAKLPQHTLILLICSTFGYESLYLEVKKTYGQKVR